MRIIERKDAKYLLFGILEISEKKRENHSNSEKNILRGRKPAKCVWHPST